MRQTEAYLLAIVGASFVVTVSVAFLTRYVPAF